MKYLLIAALSVAVTPAIAAEPDICYAGEIPADAIATDHVNGTPFTGMDRTLTALYLPRALCGFDVTKDLAFWRSYYTTFGCSAESEVAQLMEAWLTEAPENMQADFDAARAQSPERVATLCTRVSDCVVPETYDIEGETGLYCPSLGN